MTWGDSFPALLVAVVCLLGPGLIVTAPFRFGTLARTAVSGLVGMCVVASAATIFGAFGLAFAWWQVLIVTAVGLALALAVRPAVPRLEPRADRRVLLLLGMWLLSALAIAIVMFWRVPIPDRIAQTQDNVFHLSATGAILSGHSASPFAIGGLIDTTGAFTYSPSGWHSFAALVAQTTGVPVAVAFNVLFLATIAVVWLPGIAWLARTVVPTWAAATIALPLGASFGWYPYGLLTGGALYPSALAHALLPAAVGIVLVAARAVLGDRGRVSRARRWTAAVVGVALAGGALAAADPRAIATLFVIVAPFVFWRLIIVLRQAHEAAPGELRRARYTLWGSVSAAAVVIAAGLIFGNAAMPLTGRPGDTTDLVAQSPWQSLTQVVMAQSQTGVNGVVTIVAPPLALAVIGGVFMALRRAATRWVVISYLVLALLYVLAAGDVGPVSSMIAALWLGDPYRLAAALAIVGVPLATIGIVALGRLIVPARRAFGAGAAIVTAVIVGVTSTGTLAATGVSEAAGAVFRQPVQASDRAIVSSAQMTFMRHQVSAVVPENQRVLGDPWDGAALTGVFAGREPVFPHLRGRWDDARLTLAYSLPSIDESSEVCAALDELRVRHVLYTPGSFGGGDPDSDLYLGVHAAVDAGLFTEVATDDESSLYRIDQCGDLG
ncbi:DUF6541 family protein [Microbacterium sp. JB110]|uniref:DUF6541 family protein n=1 Tax=Microbacterium sp. JB110 TaxID=2024477 RepID=UPI00097EC1AB|nr:DUF6541 family protein [Microbacterium sp. JB110]RCS61823.1 hypothetical protein CIK77_03665 [Microbacterium sp. JB110]SJM66087.1 hypothetical protein CZ774_14205 [Frigoribacterium sp. JB110]